MFLILAGLLRIVIFLNFKLFAATRIILQYIYPCLIHNSSHIGPMLQPKLAMWSSREQTMQIIEKSAYPHVMELLQVRKDYSVCH